MLPPVLGPMIIGERSLLHWNNSKSAQLLNDVLEALVFLRPLGVLDRNLEPIT